MACGAGSILGQSQGRWFSRGVGPVRDQGRNRVVVAADVEGWAA